MTVYTLSFFSFDFFIQFLNFYAKIFFIHVSVDCLFLLAGCCFYILIMSYFVPRLTKGFRLCSSFECDHNLMPTGLSGWDVQEDSDLSLSISID